MLTRPDLSLNPCPSPLSVIRCGSPSSPTPDHTSDIRGELSPTRITRSPADEVGKKNRTSSLKMKPRKMGFSTRDQFGNLRLFLLFNLHNVLVANESSISGKAGGEEVIVSRILCLKNTVCWD